MSKLIIYYKSPLPLTNTEVAFFPVLTSSATSFSAYSKNLLFSSFKVIFVPYFPENGEVLT